jgi:hypothetical protein
VTLWEHEHLVEVAQRRLEQEPGMMQIRKQAIEHPFGTIISWMGSMHFQMKTLKRVSTEMNLHVLAYNMKRVMQIVGIKPLIEAIQSGQPA